MYRKRIRDFNIQIGDLKTGPLNKITDVPGVNVGHVTLKSGEINTGVTAILPSDDNLFKNKMISSAHVFNGFGKSTGLVQIEELGTLETPIILTNTFGVGDALRGLLEYKLERNPEIGDTTGTVNGVVCECNDAYLNDIRGLHVKPEHVHEAIQNAQVNFEEGDVGAGTGMSAFTLKGGIGSSSRCVKVGENLYTVGVLVMTNMGRKKNLIIDGKRVGEKLVEMDSSERNEPDKGSIIIVIATDTPLSTLQLKRVIKRSIVGLSRTGSNMGHGSGEIVIGFSTANRISHDLDDSIQHKYIHDDQIDSVFDAVIHATEEAVLNSMVTAENCTGRGGHTRETIAFYSELFL